MSLFSIFFWGTHAQICQKQVDPYFVTSQKVLKFKLPPNFHTNMKREIQIFTLYQTQFSKKKDRPDL